MEPLRKLTTKEKALNINLDERTYGTIAEIGGGQEVAMHFFKAGAASNTIAKTMSAYDMVFSDAIYGKTDRYVSEEKLLRMLEKEYNLLSQRLTARAKRSCFFAFANTVETLNYHKTNQGHGWIGIKFQLHPQSEPNECIMHVVLNDTESEWQQNVLGILGINLIYACFMINDPEQMILSLKENIETGRFEVDMFRISGPDFHHVDNRLLSLKLVKNGLSNAAMFDPKGNTLQPSEALYKRNVLVLRGRFRPVTHVNVDMLITGLKHFKTEKDVEREKIVVLTEITLTDLATSGQKVDEADFLDRVNIICSLGQNVLISNYTEHYKLSAYLAQFTKKKKIGIIIGIYNLVKIFDESFYENLRGGILESFSRLFGANTKLYVYPAINPEDKEECITALDWNPPIHLKSLYRYLLESHKIEDIKGANHKVLHIISDDVLKKIQSGEEGWEICVPQKVSQAIKTKYLFGFPAPIPTEED